jgi:enamine deaminase RidA (YjgF/YER057c/UK114 family)
VVQLRNDDGSIAGRQLEKLQALVRYWGTGYDWRKVDAKITPEALMTAATNDPLAPRTSATVSAEQRMKDLSITLPAPPRPLGTYAEAVQTGNLLFLSGMLPTAHNGPAFVGRVGAELDVDTAARAARRAALNALAVAREHLGSLDRVTRIVRLGVSVATSGDVRDQPKVADGASNLPQDVFGEARNPCRLVYGVASLPLGAPVELEVIFEVKAE